MVKFEMEVKYTKYDIQMSSIQRTIGKTLFKAYSQQINIPDGQGISNLYHDIFSNFYDFLTPFITPGYHKVIELLIDENVPVGSRVLDLCSGTGNVAFIAAKRAKEVFGLDASYGMLSKAREKAEKQGIRNIKFIHGDVRKRLDFADESFDVVTSGLSVPLKVPLFCDHNEDIVKETYRVLKNDSKLAVFTGWEEVSDIYFSRKEYEDLLSEVGYKHMEMKNIKNIYVIVSARK